MDPTTDDLADDLSRVQQRTADAAKETTDAVVKASDLCDGAGHPLSKLEATHDALMDAYAETVRALDRVEQILDDADGEYVSPTPRQIKSEHADRLKEQYDGPILNLALMLLEHNRREWLHWKRGTRGAEAVERHGLTRNQRRWLNDLQEAWREYDAE